MCQTNAMFKFAITLKSRKRKLFNTQLKPVIRYSLSVPYGARETIRAIGLNLNNIMLLLDS